MSAQSTSNIIDCYNKTAQNYAGKYMEELDHKHLDRLLLTAFAAENKTKGKMIDLGCGPGQTTKFLYDLGIKEIVGTDISPEMIQVAKQLNPQIHFETADMLSLQYADHSFGAAVAFYSIVHFTTTQLAVAFQEISRILQPGASFLFSFHIGEQVVHMNEFLGQQVQIDFYFFEINTVTALLEANGFRITDVVERQPYKEAEYPSQRAYIWVEKI